MFVCDLCGYEFETSTLADHCDCSFYHKCIYYGDMVAYEDECTCEESQVDEEVIQSIMRKLRV